MPNWVDVMVAQERYGDMLRENEQERRVAQMNEQTRRPSLWRRLARWLGRPARREPRLLVVGSNGNALPISGLCEPPEEGTGHYLN
jgi:hypothetical protein